MKISTVTNIETINNLLYYFLLIEFSLENNIKYIRINITSRDTQEIGS